MKTDLIIKASRLASKAGLQLKKHSPEIFMVAGIAGTVASTVMACKATTKIDAIMKEKEKNVENIHICLEDPNVEYTEEDSKKDLTIIYTQTGVKLLKLYAPSVALGVLSITSILTGHHILKKRHVALAAAYTIVDKGFKEYRKNVVDRFGKEVDHELRYNIKAEEVEEVTTDENGNEIVNKKIVNAINKDDFSQLSEHARFFDESSTQWHKDAEYNKKYLICQQNYANDVLRSRGYIFLNEVYEMLGLPKTKAGQIVGWVYDENNEHGDNFVDFGIFDVYTNNPLLNEARRDFTNNLERSILLDFNVDGPIYDIFNK